MNAAKVTAARCKKFAASCLHETEPHLSPEAAASLRKAANTGSINNAERDLHRLFREKGLTLPICPKSAPGLENVQYLSLPTWFQFLLNRYPSLLLGGFARKDWNAALLLNTFWSNFQRCFPQHEFFTIHDENKWCRCLPFFLHIDEGVGLKKGAVLVLSWQGVFGRETSERFATYRDIEDEETRMTQAQMHNARGSTYLTRWLYTALPKKTYGGKTNKTYEKVLDLLAKECRDLMLNGVTIQNETWYPCCLGMKGDQPAVIKSGKFRRSFMNLGFNKGCCWECCAGISDLPFEEVSLFPKWEKTIGLCDPWTVDDPSPLLQIPGYGINAHQFWKRDPFHAFKQSIGGHFTASLIVIFAVDFGLWKVPGLSGAADELLDRAFQDFRYWICFEWHGRTTNHVIGFTRALLHFSDMKQFPYCRFKGSDMMLIVRWLRFVIQNGVYLPGSVLRTEKKILDDTSDEWQKKLFEAALKGCEGSLLFFHTLHNEGIWHFQPTAKNMAMECFKFCLAYQSLATLCHEKHMARFHLEPSLHTMMHFYVELARAGPVSLSPAISTTEMDEDFVGKICRTCRNTHALSTTRRCIDRYLLRCHHELEGL